MAEHSNSQELENNSWVFTGSEAPPVEDLGFEASEETLLEASPTESELFVDSPDLEEDESKSPKTENVPGQILSPESTVLPLLDEKKTESQNPAEECYPISQETVTIPQTGPLHEEMDPSAVGEASASPEADVEGLRRRRGHLDVHHVGPQLSHEPAKDALREEDDGFSRTKWLLAVLALVGFGILATLGVILDTEDGALDMLNMGLSSDGEEPYPADSGKGWSPSLDPAADSHLGPGKKASPSADISADPKSLDAMAQLLDTLAKENQDIRLMQAELQAQKEELHDLLRKSEEEASGVTSQQADLAAENSRLAEALQRERAALAAARGEIQLLREKVSGLDQAGDAGARQPPEEAPRSRHPPAKLGLQERELRQLHSLLASLRLDLARAIPKASLEELKHLEERLAREVARGEAGKGARVPWKEGAKGRPGRGKPWHKKHQGEEKPRQQERDPKGVPPPERGPHPPKRPLAPLPAKPPKGGEPQRGNRKARKPAEPRELWETLARRPYSAPQGCSGVTECARREGLAPVQKAAFLKLVQNYLAGLGWGQHSGELVPVLEGFFGSDGVFAHERVSFVEFVDDVEDALEDLAEALGVSDDVVDDFEDVVLKHLGRRSSAKEPNREGPAHKNRAHG